MRQTRSLSDQSHISTEDLVAETHIVIGGQLLPPSIEVLLFSIDFLRLSTATEAELKLRSILLL